MSLETVHLFPITNTTLRNKPNDSPAVFNISLLGETTNKQTRCFTVIVGVLASIVCHLKYKVWQVFKHITVLSKHKNLGKQLTIYKSLKTAFPFSLDCFINWHAKQVPLCMLETLQVVKNSSGEAFWTAIGRIGLFKVAQSGSETVFFFFQPTETKNNLIIA